MKKVFIISALTLMSVAMFGQAEEIAKAYAKEQIKVWVNDRDVQYFFDQYVKKTPKYLYNILKEEAVYTEYPSMTRKVIETIEESLFPFEKKTTYLNYCHVVKFSDYEDSKRTNIDILVYFADNMEIAGIELKLTERLIQKTFSKYNHSYMSFETVIDGEMAEMAEMIEQSEEGDWITRSGEHLSEKPTTSGVYIHNGRRTIIK